MISEHRINRQRNLLGTAVTHETVDFGILFEREVERERGEEDDRLHVVEVRYPVLALFARNPQAVVVEASEKAQRGMASSSRIGITAHSTRITMIIGS